MSLPEKFFGLPLFFFFLDGFIKRFRFVAVLNSRATGEVSVISSLGPLAVAPLHYYPTTGLFINLLRPAVGLLWKHIENSNNVKH